VSSQAKSSIQIYRQKSWPSGAPAVEDVMETARSLRSAVNEGLPARTTYSLDRIVVNANKRVSVSLEEPKPGSIQLRTHWLLLDDGRLAPALVDGLSSGRFPRVMREIVDEVRHRAPTSYCYSSSKRTYQSKGEWIDLGRVLEAVRRYLPDNNIARDVTIGWGRKTRSRKRRQRSIKLGSMVDRERLIRVHPVLDNPWIPGHVIEFVVYHELCHFAAPPLTARQARKRQEHRIHHRTFRTLENQFPDKASAEQWIDDNLDRLLRKASQ
jgi:hypothetical protein